MPDRLEKILTQFSLPLLAVLVSVTATAQDPGSTEPCGTVGYNQELLKNDPDFNNRINKIEDYVSGYSESYKKDRKGREQAKSAAGKVRIIPVVFHVIHVGGSQNISDAQAHSALEVLNEDFRRLNADTVDTPAPFKPVAADTEIEFKLATIDPNGNCTDGIVRVYSQKTFVGDNTVKALSYWPRDQYLNVWVFNQAIPTPGQPPRTGYAQFPWSNNPASTDGVVLGHAYAGRINAAANSEAGRWITHEVGHWLGLRHIWGDAQCGDDFCADTPIAHFHHGNLNCPTHPLHVDSCGPGTSPNGEMFMNYMDYMTGSCMNIVTMDQTARMHAFLDSSLAGRNNLWTQANLIATGTDSAAVPNACAPKADFNTDKRRICKGSVLNFSEYAYNGDVTSMLWNFPGGTPSTSTDSMPSVTYNTPGIYDVTLIVSNSIGSDTLTINDMVSVYADTGSYGIPFYESFENIVFPGNDWEIENEVGVSWAQTTSAAKTGNSSVYLNNYSPLNPGVDAFITPAFNLSWSTSHVMTFELAHAIRSTQSTDQLKVYVSTTCGQLWSLRYTKQGANLATTPGIVGPPFFPSASQWETQTVNLASSSFNNKPNVRIKFEYTQHSGNNTFIDDINIDGTVGIEDVTGSQASFSVYPNPVRSSGVIDFKLTDEHLVYIDVVDVLGHVVEKITETRLDAGDYQFTLPADLANGLYNIRLYLDGVPQSKKILINR